MSKKTEEEIALEREKAKEQLEAILCTSRPKNLGEGVSTGLNNIISGAVGAAGVAVLAPTVGLAFGLRSGGIIGGVIGVAGGAAVGLLGAAAMAVGGVVSGVTQIGRGIVSVPASITAPRQGKWWNERQGQWTLTDMKKETEWIKTFPNEDDTDILGKVQNDLDASIKLDGTSSGTVVDMFYYECLEIPADAEGPAIKRQYYLLARKYHPDKNPNDTVAAEKFKNIAEAYQVLSDPALRKKYDTDGKDGLSPDKTSVVDGNLAGKLDPAILFAFLFGSDQFKNYIGRLSTATSASVGDSPKISIKDASELQKRRVTRLAVALLDKITPWVQAAIAKDEAAKTTVEAEWIGDADTLSKASFGYQLVTTIGKVCCCHVCCL
jgi:curved DNA-binding protein CbpA